MEYDDFLLPNTEIMSKMQAEFEGVTICDMTQEKQKAELDEIFRLLNYCQGFLKWLEGEDGDFEELKKLIEETEKNKVSTAGNCCRRDLDYRYVCDKDFNQNCCNYCKCELEILDRVIKLMTLKSSIIDKQCMMRLLKSRMDTLKLVFNRYCN